MEKINRCFLVKILLAISTIAFTQSLENSWYIGVGGYATDHTSVDPISGFFDINDYSFMPPISKVTLARRLNHSFSLDLQVSTGEITNKRLNIRDKFFLLTGLGLRYKFANNGSLLKENFWIDPYLRIGGNYNHYNYSMLTISNNKTFTAYDKNYQESYLLDKDFSGKKNHFIINGGVGLNLWFSRSLGLNLESQYNYSYHTKRYIDFFQHSASLIFRFGNNDKDKDGVRDQEDKCRKVFGLAEFNGCPNADRDELTDNIDKCPTESGPKENHGCPWPDTDRDELTDNIDKCPTESGPKENHGCPWPDVDKDGVLDNKKDNCLLVPCSKGNERCKNDEYPIDLDKKMNEEIQILFFDTNKSIIRPEEIYKLDKIVKMINNSKGRVFLVEGHTDSTGNVMKNKILSKQRAHSVINALEKRGISSLNLIGRGFGSEMPIADNSTSEGKQQNRRVEIKLEIQDKN